MNEKNIELEIDEEAVSVSELSNAARVLDRIDVSIQKLGEDGNYVFRSLSEVTGELSQKWDEVSDIERLKNECY
jgi:hypothetical protein